MEYSQWLPDRGGYAYYETSERRGLSDDLPTPRLRATSSIGVASTDIGRALPLGAKLLGYGEVARGSIVPMDRSVLSGIDSTTATQALLFSALAAASAVAGMLLVRALRK